jgi:hypothetical protein
VVQVRWKPPPPNSDIGWRVEFRSMEAQLTDFEVSPIALLSSLSPIAFANRRSIFNRPQALEPEPVNPKAQRLRPRGKRLETKRGIA